MIAGYFHKGSGLGNQLHRYVATRVLAKDKGYDFGMVNYLDFKGYSFMAIDMGFSAPYIDTKDFKVFNEKKVVVNNSDIRPYDPEINFVEDNTVIDGEFQDERYFGHRLNEIKDWFKVEPMELPDDLCIIAHRGGEYTLFPELYLTTEYWDEAIAKMRSLYPTMRFEVQTDDEVSARLQFPQFPIIHHIGHNWRSIRYAKHLILSNSSFGILPALLSDAKEIIAPRYWARHNTGVWMLPQNYYKRFTYL